MQLSWNIFAITGRHAVLAVLLVLPSAAANAADAGQLVPAGALAASTSGGAQQAAHHQHGMQVYRDPKTGRFGPPPPGVLPAPALSAAEARMLDRSDQGLQSRVLPGGGVVMDLQGRYQSMAVATVGSDGQAAVNCAVTPEQALSGLQADVRPMPRHD